MFSIEILPGFIMGIREGLEAFLIISIMLEYLNKTKRQKDKKFVFQGLAYGIIISIVFGVLLFGISNLIGEGNTNIVKLWEFGASFFALMLITTFVIYMLKNRSSIVNEINDKMSISLSKKAIILLATVMVAREGAEIVLFTMASVEKTSYAIGALSGIAMSSILVYLFYKSLIKVNLKTIFNITMIYLILQAGFMLGYSFHELFSYFKAESIIESGHWIYTKAYDLSATFLNHKNQPVGIALYATIGWYSHPEIFQFFIQYAYSFSLLFLYIRSAKKKNI
ncbi:FTR1 family iron permease [Mariniplasma anaerobium]|uniref:Iron transporter n=1 Tax=Mariniplasma anaerobium TaxID=2735436 RepID=A0A7U9XWI9_9MOLU|nr:FTR1 family protein [Mariniplasma anaerobium]BCR35508.1 iron transporter [Mariniplasma anaerobium]